MSNRPIKNKKKVVVEDYDEPEVAYRPIKTSPRDMVILGGVVLIILAFVLAPMLAFVFAPEQPNPAEPIEGKANDIDTQISIYSKQLEGAPNDPTVLANLGYFTSQKADQLAIDPKAPEKAQAERQALLQTAEGYLKKSLTFDPTYGFAQQELSKNLLSQEKYDEAGLLIKGYLEDADKDLGSADKQTAATAKSQKIQLLGISSFIDAKADKMELAVGKIAKALELDPGNPQLYMQRGRYYMQMGNKEKAKADFETVVDIGQKTGNQQAAILGMAALEGMKTPAPASPTPTAVPDTSTSVPAASTPASPAPVSTSPQESDLPATPVSATPSGNT